MLAELVDARRARRNAGSTRPPNQTGGPGRCTGFGSMRMSFSWKNSPSYDAFRSDQSARITASDSVSRFTRRPAGMPKAASWGAFSFPMPNPASTRPPLSTSSVASSFAS